MEKIGGYLYIQCGEDLLGKAAQELLDKILAHKGEHPRGVVLGLRDLKGIEISFFRLIAYVGKTLRAERKKFYGVGASAELTRELRENGLDSSIQLVASTDQLEGEGQVKPQKINVEFVNPFVEATQKTLAIQCNLQVTTGKLYLKGAQPSPQVDIAGVIGVTSKAFSGSIALCFPKQTFLGAMEGMLGERYADITDDLKDGAGELLNIIFGQSKNVLNEKGYTIEKAIPTVISGTALQLQHLVTSPAIVLPFETGVGSFFLEVGCGGN